MSYYPQHYCALFGAIGIPNASECTYYGLYSQQHRGQESAGIVSTDGKEFFSHKGMGLVNQVFAGDVLSRLVGNMAIGHNRYSTTGSSELRNAQPLALRSRFGNIALAHNGNLTNTRELRAELTKAGTLLQTDTDSEVMLCLLAQAPGELEQAVVAMMGKVKGAYSLIIMTTDELIAVRDPHGFRPLSIGKLGKGYVVASETCAFDLTKAEFQSDVQPGEVVILNKDGMRSFMSERLVAEAGGRHFCAFEKIYFARRSSLIDGERVEGIRQHMGRILAREFPIDADVVAPIPAGGIPAATGYSRESGITYVQAFEQSPYPGRSFLKPNQKDRDRAVDIKLSLIPEEVSGKRVIIVDDSIVRGTTSQARIRKIREAGAKEVHLLISCPPHKNACVYGIDFPDRGKLLANNHSHDDIRNKLGLDSLGYLSMAGLEEALGTRGHCLACFNGKYPGHQAGEIQN